MDPDIEDTLERAHFRSVVAAFRSYKQHTLERINKSEAMIGRLPESHQRRLARYRDYLREYRRCADVNNVIVMQIIKDVETMFENVDHRLESNGAADGEGDGDGDGDGAADGNGDADGFTADYVNGMDIDAEDHKIQHDVEKVQSVLKNLVRDWSAAGAAEREQCYRPIVDEILAQFPQPESERESTTVLVPGAGLGRLAWEIAARGFACQGNEYSLYMLFASHFVLNKCHETESYALHPWLHQYVNNVRGAAQAARVRVPDVAVARGTRRLSMAAGDFLKVYTQENEWHCVATCFFIDCAPNVIAFIENIYRILRAGGVWVNLGPLLYHYSDLATEDSIEPPYDILLDIIKDVGFTILKEKTGVKTKYAQNPNSMLQHEYDSVFFVCRKPD